MKEVVVKLEHVPKMSPTVEQLERIGGRRWQNNDADRIYFQLPELMGLETTHYKTGHISGATYRGERISNSEARRIGDKFFSAKLWFDVQTGKFFSSGLSAEDARYAVSVINELINKEEE